MKLRAKLNIHILKNIYPQNCTECYNNKNKCQKFFGNYEEHQPHEFLSSVENQVCKRTKFDITKIKQSLF